jgi:Zn-dependent peptidase ImmA (M78 family)
MKIFHQRGNKERLFKNMKFVNNLNEEILPVDKKEQIIQDFIDFVLNKFDLDGEGLTIVISYDSEDAKQMKSFGKYIPDEDYLLIVASNRNLADVLRTLVHEIWHHKQKLENRLEVDSNNDGSEIENEANAMAAIVMREFGRENPLIYE